MRAAAVLLAFTLTCATAPGGNVEMRNLAAGGYAVAQINAKQAVAARDADTYARLWSSLIGEGERPAVDFASESVVFLLAGSRPTGGYSVEARGVALEEKTLVVDAEVKGPPPGSMVTQALTSPYAVVAVKTREFEDVRW